MTDKLTGIAATCPGCGVMGAGCICPTPNYLSWSGDPPSPNPTPITIQMGWQCPVCRMVLSPYSPNCICHLDRKETAND